MVVQQRSEAWSLSWVPMVPQDLQVELMASRPMVIPMHPKQVVLRRTV
jgi:hypothetical protein